MKPHFKVNDDDQVNSESSVTHMNENNGKWHMVDSSQYHGEKINHENITLLEGDETSKDTISHNKLYHQQNHRKPYHMKPHFKVNDDDQVNSESSVTHKNENNGKWHMADSSQYDGEKINYENITLLEGDEPSKDTISHNRLYHQQNHRKPYHMKPHFKVNDDDQVNSESSVTHMNENNGKWHMADSSQHDGEKINHENITLLEGDEPTKDTILHNKLYHQQNHRKPYHMKPHFKVNDDDQVNSESSVTQMNENNGKWHMADSSQHDGEKINHENITLLEGDEPLKDTISHNKLYHQQNHRKPYHMNPHFKVNDDDQVNSESSVTHMNENNGKWHIRLHSKTVKSTQENSSRMDDIIDQTSSFSTTPEKQYKNRDEHPNNNKDKISGSEPFYRSFYISRFHNQNADSMSQKGISNSSDSEKRGTEHEAFNHKNITLSEVEDPILHNKFYHQQNRRKPYRKNPHFKVNDGGQVNLKSSDLLHMNHTDENNRIWHMISHSHKVDLTEENCSSRGDISDQTSTFVTPENESKAQDENPKRNENKLDKNDKIPFHRTPYNSRFHQYAHMPLQLTDTNNTESQTVIASSTDSENIKNAEDIDTNNSKNQTDVASSTDSENIRSTEDTHMRFQLANSSDSISQKDIENATDSENMRRTEYTPMRIQLMDTNNSKSQTDITSSTDSENRSREDTHKKLQVADSSDLITHKSIDSSTDSEIIRSTQNKEDSLERTEENISQTQDQNTNFTNLEFKNLPYPSNSHEDVTSPFLYRKNRGDGAGNKDYDEAESIAKENMGTIDSINKEASNIFSTDEATDSSLFEESDLENEDTFFGSPDPTDSPFEKVTVSLPKSFLIEEIISNMNQTNGHSNGFNKDIYQHNEIVTVDPKQWYGKNTEGSEIIDENKNENISDKNKISTEFPTVVPENQTTEESVNTIDDNTVEYTIPKNDSYTQASEIPINGSSLNISNVRLTDKANDSTFNETMEVTNPDISDLKTTQDTINIDANSEISLNASNLKVINDRFSNKDNNDQNKTVEQENLKYEINKSKKTDTKVNQTMEEVKNVDFKIEDNVKKNTNKTEEIDDSNNKTYSGILDYFSTTDTPEIITTKSIKGTTSNSSLNMKIVPDYNETTTTTSTYFNNEIVTSETDINIITYIVPIEEISTTETVPKAEENNVSPTINKNDILYKQNILINKTELRQNNTANNYKAIIISTEIVPTENQNNNELNEEIEMNYPTDGTTISSAYENSTVLTNKAEISKNSSNVNEENTTPHHIFHISRHKNTKSLINKTEIKKNNTVNIYGPMIATNILGKITNISIVIQIKNESIYVPSNVTIKEDLDNWHNYILNFTWPSEIKDLNHTISLNLTKTLTKHYKINRVQLRLVKDGNVSIWTKTDITQPMENETENEFKLTVENNVIVMFSNVNFLEIVDIQNSINDIQSAASKEKTGSNMELIMGIVVCTCLIMIFLYLVVRRVIEKRRS